MKVEFSPSLMCMDFLKMEEQFNILNDKVDMYHIDTSARILHCHQTW